MRAIGQGELCLLVSEHPTPPEPSVAASRQHHAVVEAAMLKATPVPLRFGQWISDDAVAVAVLQTSHEKWVRLLDRFDGAVEFGVRVFDPARESDAPASSSGEKPTGSEYMAALARRISGPDASRAEVAMAFRECVNELVIDERTEALRTAHGVASVAHLLHRANIEAYREAVDAVRLKVPRLRLLSTGPWPPYSFVE